MESKRSQINEATSDSSSQLAPQEPRRRRLVRGAAAGMGVLFAAQAKTALGSTVCQSPSAMISGNTSPRPGDGTSCSGGRSPGFWKVPNHFTYWNGATPPTFKVRVQECLKGMGNLSNDDLATRGTDFNTIFGSGGPADTGIWSIMAFPTDYGPNGQLMRHLVSAWLNAGYFTADGAKYPLTRAEIIKMWEQTRNGGTYCPTSLGTTCGTKGMTASDVIYYIENLYDYNAPVENDLCKNS